MKYTSVYRNVKVSKALDEGIKATFEKLAKYFKVDFGCHAVVSTKGKEPMNASVEITIKADGQIYRAESISDDFYKSVREDYDKIRRQIRKYRTKILSKKRGKDNVFIEEGKEFNENYPENEIIRKKRFEIIPMSAENAIMQLDILDHDFFIFTNEETEEINVVYKRKDSGYGIIEIAN